MEWFLASIGILIIGFGGYIWHFKPIHLLSNIPKADRILDKARAAHLGGSYLILMGILYILFSYAIKNLSSETISIVVACFIPVNMVVLVSYLVAQSKNLK
jgi:hypothetical protein